MPGLVLLIAGLLADEHHERTLGSFAEDGLGSELPEMASATGGGRGAKLGKRRAWRDEVGGGTGGGGSFRHQQAAETDVMVDELE